MRAIFYLLIILISSLDLNAQVYQKDTLKDTITSKTFYSAQFPGGTVAFNTYITPYIDSLSTIDENTLMPIKLTINIDTFGKATLLNISPELQLGLKDITLFQNAIQKMPIWKPAMLNGRKVEEKIVLPFIVCYD